MSPDCDQHVSRHLSACSPPFPKSIHRVNARGCNGCGRSCLPRPLLLTSLPARLESCTWRLWLDVSCRHVAVTGMDWSQRTQQLVVRWSRRDLLAPLYFYDARVKLTHWDAKGLTNRQTAIIYYSKARADHPKGPAIVASAQRANVLDRHHPSPNAIEAPDRRRALLQAAHHTRPAEHGRRGRGSCHSLERCACATLCARHAAANASVDF